MQEKSMLKGALIGADMTSCLSCGETLLCNRDAEPLCARCRENAPCQAMADLVADAAALPISADAAALLDLQPGDFFAREYDNLRRLVLMRPVPLGQPATGKIALIEADGELVLIEWRDGQPETLPTGVRIVAVSVAIIEGAAQ
jgi:hypothetical protein